MNQRFDIYFNDDTFTDINPLFIGMEQCESGHSYGPRICPYTILHYVVSGKGTLEYKGENFEIHSGQFFIIFEGEAAKYYADSEDPWKYTWIAYDGLYMNRLNKLQKYVFDIDSEIFESFIKNTFNGVTDKYSTASLIYYIYSLHLTDAKTESVHNYPNETKRIIKLKYMQSITVFEIAKMLNIDKRYMSRIFKEKYGKTVISYLIEIRMKRACELLTEGYSVADTASMVGYTDAFNFSKMFRKQVGLSPREYKNSYTRI